MFVFRVVSLIPNWVQKAFIFSVAETRESQENCSRKYLEVTALQGYLTVTCSLWYLCLHCFCTFYLGRLLKESLMTALRVVNPRNWGSWQLKLADPETEEKYYYKPEVLIVFTILRMYVQEYFGTKKSILFIIWKNAQRTILFFHISFSRTALSVFNRECGPLLLQRQI